MTCGLACYFNCEGDCHLPDAHEGICRCLHHKNTPEDGPDFPTVSSDSPAERLRITLYLLRVLSELERDPDTTMHLAVIATKPDGTGIITGMLDAEPFLADLGPLVNADPMFDPAAIAADMKTTHNIESTKTLGITTMIALDYIQRSLGLPRDPEMAKMLDSIEAMRARKP